MQKNNLFKKKIFKNFFKDFFEQKIFDKYFLKKIIKNVVKVTCVFRTNKFLTTRSDLTFDF